MKKLVRILAVMMIAVLLLSVASCKKKEKVYDSGKSFKKGKKKDSKNHRKGKKK